MGTIDKHPNDTALAFIKNAISIAQKLSGDELLLWSRSEDEFFERLKIGEVEFLQEITNEQGMVPACQEESLRDVFGRGQFRCMHAGEIPVSTIDDLKQKYPATPERVVMPYKTICRLSVEELKSFIDQDLSNSVLTPQQASCLMAEQSFRKRSGPLSFDENNYVLMQSKDNEIIPMLIFWKKSKEYPFAKNAWDFWERHDVAKGRLLLAI